MSTDATAKLKKARNTPTSPSHTERDIPKSVGRSLETTSRVEDLDDFLDADRIKIAGVIDNTPAPIVSTDGANVGHEYAVSKFGSIPSAVVESGDPCTIDDLHDFRGATKELPSDTKLNV